MEITTDRITANIYVFPYSDVTGNIYIYIYFFWGGVSTNSVEDRGQRERRSGGGSPLVRGSIQFANE
jgi:hypothetical protein